MNTYNDNLRNTVVSSLQSQELDQITVQGELNSALFTLYYAEGATISAKEKLLLDTNGQKEKQEVNRQAVNNSNISNNLVSSATQANTYLQQSIANTSVCAANVQIAANAIVGLAGDVGNIYSILNAADYDSDMYSLATEINILMNDTAYSAEVASKISMETSILTSEVTSTIVLNKAKSTNAAMTNLLNITAAEFADISQVVENDHNTVASTSVTEKQAEGNLEDIYVEYKATNSAYNSSNRLLNQNLCIKKPTDTSFNVEFDLIHIPFFGKSEQVANSEIIKVIGNYPYYPVDKYYLIVVKNAKKYTFSLNDAESLLGNNNQCIPVDMANVKKRNAKVTNSDKLQLGETTEYVEQTINIANIVDSDKDAVMLGTDYVVFMFAVYAGPYKKVINNFEDFLSAASPTFCLTNKLQEVNPSGIHVAQLTDKSIQITQGPVIPSQGSNKGDTYKVWFRVNKDPNYNDVEHRIMFLPKGDDLARNMLTEKLLETDEKNIELMEKVADRYNPEIAKLEGTLAELQIKLKAENGKDVANLQAQIDVVNAEIKWINNIKEAAIVGITNNLTIEFDALEVNVLKAIWNVITITDKTTSKEKKAIAEKLENSIKELIVFEAKIFKKAEKYKANHPNSNIAKTLQKIEQDLGEIVLDEFLSIMEKNPAERKKLQHNIKSKINQLEKLNAELIQEEETIKKPGSSQLGFVFNLALAEQVPSGNFTNSVLLTSQQKNLGNGQTVIEETWGATFGPETTDNFGNQLLSGGDYIPVVYSLTGIIEENKHQVTNTLSDFERTSSFKYQSINN